MAVLIAIPMCFSYVFAGTETYYTDFEVLSPHIVFTGEEQTTGYYEWSLTNNDTQNIVWEFHFVDAVPLLSGAYYACKSDTETWVFGKYLHMDWSTNFTVEPWQTITWVVNFDFPDSYSWIYYGCIVYSVGEVGNQVEVPDGADVNSVADMTSRKAIPVSVTLQAAKVHVYIVANLWSRGNAQTSNNNWYESKWKLLFYPWNHAPSDLPIESWYVIMNHDGFGELTWVEVLAGTYDVVYKWWHHLASYIPNVTINEWDTLNFVLDAIWVGLFEQEDKFKYNSWWAYQIAWDLPDASGYYNFEINTLDLSILRWSGLCSYNQKKNKPDLCDLNNDWVVNSTDDTVILKQLPQRKSDDVYDDQQFMKDGFGYVNYWETYVH